MQGFLIVVGILLGLSGIVESRRCISEDEIDKLIERKMETIIQKYDRKIALLEKRINSQENKIHSQEKKIHSQAEKIRNLEEKCFSSLDREKERENLIRFHMLPNHGNSSTLQKNPEQKTTNGYGAQERKVRVASTSDVVAFCAYMTTTEHSPSLHHVLVFDDVRTNIGFAFNRISGMFTAPIDGAYAFTWTIFSDKHSYIFSQIVINTQSFTSLITDSDEISDYHSSTGLIIVSLNSGDVVYIRTHPTERSNGNIFSGSIRGRPSFSGWKL